VLQKKVESFGNPNLYAVSLVADALSQSKQPLVPETLFSTGGDNPQGMLGTLMSMLVAEKVGVKFPQKVNETGIEIVQVVEE
jgi:hypothetical protein